MSMARLTLRLDFGPGQAIGHGKIRLLEAVRDYGSISAAGRSMEMSYRRAWLLIDELNELFEGPVIETKHGGARRRRRPAHAVGLSCDTGISLDRDQSTRGRRCRPRCPSRGDDQATAKPMTSAI